MQTKDHLALGRYLADSFSMEPVKRIAFLTGNIMPDINKFSYIHGYLQLLYTHMTFKKRNPLTINDHRRMLIGGHTAEGSRFFVNRIYRTLRKKKFLTIYDYYRLGKAMHYLADRFTYPHTMQYRDGFFAHIHYEEKLHSLMHDMFCVIPNMRKEVACCFPHTDFNGMYRAYRKSVQGAGKVLHDCLYILAISIAYLENILYNKKGYYLQKK